MNKGNRFERFAYVIKNLKEMILKSGINASISVHEAGDKQTLSEDFIKNYLDQYIFNEYKEVYNGAWQYNVNARYCKLPKNKLNYFVFLDGDMLVNEEWIEELKKVDSPTLAWNKIYYLNEDQTNYLLYNQENPNWELLQYEKIVEPNINGACGRLYCYSGIRIFWYKRICRRFQWHMRSEMIIFFVGN